MNPAIYCAKCEKRVYWRKRTDHRYEPATTYHVPDKCSHCGAKPDAEGESITVSEEMTA